MITENDRQFARRLKSTHPDKRSKLWEARDAFDDLKEHRGEKQCVLRGLNILARYDDNIRPSFGHDQMWASDFEETIAKMTVEEVAEMLALNWFEGEDSWSHF